MKRIAPALGISKRFVGNEPYSPVTNAYNTKMKELLPAHGIELVEILRYGVDGDSSGLAVSASRVRKLLKDGDIEAARMLLPKTSFEIISRIMKDKEQVDA